MNNSTNNSDLEKLLKSIQEKKAHLSSVNNRQQSESVNVKNNISSSDQLIGFIKNSLQSLIPNLSKCEHFFANVKKYKDDLINEFNSKKISDSYREEFFELVTQTEAVLASVNFKKNNLENVILHNQLSIIQNNWNNFYGEYQVFLADFSKIRLFLLKNEIVFDSFVGVVAEKVIDNKQNVSLVDIDKKNHLQQKRDKQEKSLDAISRKLNELMSAHEKSDSKNMNAALMIKNFMAQISHIKKTVDRLEQKFSQEIAVNHLELAEQTIEQIDMEISFLQTGIEQLVISLEALQKAASDAREKTGKIIPQNTSLISLNDQQEEDSKDTADNATLLAQGEQKNKLLNYVADVRMKISQINKNVSFATNNNREQLPEYKKQLLAKMIDSLHLRDKELNAISEMVNQSKILNAKSELELFKVNFGDLEKMNQLFNEQKNAKLEVSAIVPTENASPADEPKVEEKVEQKIAPTSSLSASTVKKPESSSSELTLEIALRKDDKVILEHKKTLEKILGYLNELKEVIHLNHVAIHDYEKNEKFQELLGKELTSETFRVLKSHISMQEKFIKVIDSLFKPILEGKEIDNKKLQQEEKAAQELVKIIFEDVINFVDQSFECLNINFIKPPKKEKEQSPKKRLKLLETNQKDIKKHLAKANELHKEYLEKTSKFRNEHPLLEVLFDNYSAELDKLVKELTRVSQLDNEKDLEQVIFANNFAELLWTKNDSLIFEKMNEKFLKKIIV